MVSRGIVQTQLLWLAFMLGTAPACAHDPAPRAKAPVASDELEDWEKGEVDIPDRESCKYCPTGECEGSYSDPAVLRCARYREPRPTN